LADTAFLVNVVQQVVPDEVYNLAGVTTLKEAYEHPEKTWKINYESVGVLVDASLRMNPLVRFLQASSSEIFLPSEHALHEESPRDWETKNPYAKAKMAADRDFIETARREKGAFACSAFLFNHESPRRREDAALRKITRELVKIHLGWNRSSWWEMLNSFVIGDLPAITSSRCERYFSKKFQRIL
jgi:GDPmannose 4,6-dehydratase